MNVAYLKQVVKMIYSIYHHSHNNPHLQKHWVILFGDEAFIILILIFTQLLLICKDLILPAAAKLLN